MVGEYFEEIAQGTLEEMTSARFFEDADNGGGFGNILKDTLGNPTY